MPKHINDQSKKGKTKLANPKNIFLKSEKNLPMTDSIDWNKRILKGTQKERAVAIKEAAEKKDASAVDALMNALIDYSCEGCGHHRDFYPPSDKCEDCDEILNFSAIEALGEIGVSNEQFKRLIRMFQCYGGECAKNVARVLGELKNPAAINVLLDVVKNDEENDEKRCAAAEALGEIGNKQAVEPVKKLAAYFASKDKYSDLCFGVYLALEKLKVPDQEINNIIDGKSITRDYFKSSDQKAVYQLLHENPNIKRIVLEGAKVLNVLPDKQAWITINDPQLAKDALELALEKLGKKTSGIDNALVSNLGVRIKQLEEVHFTYYADEILDTISHVIRNSKLRNDTELSSLLSQIKYGNGGMQLRYVRREMADLSLGDKCGDCTAKGSVNFGISLTWLANPAYQILKISKGKRFIGKMNFTLGNLDGKDAIIIDAMEFNPAHKEKYGLECMNNALKFLGNLAKTEKRELISLLSSNSDLINVLGMWGEDLSSDDRKIELSLLIPAEDVSKILANIGYKGKVNLYYQMLNTLVDTTQDRKDPIDKKLPVLEQEVINPAQIENSEISAAMQERDFEKASKFILADSKLEGKIKKIFNLPKEYGISPKFLSVRLEKIYKTQAMDSESLKRTFVVEAKYFIRL